jgi:flagellar hook-basal body complex protein FliE
MQVSQLSNVLPVRQPSFEKDSAQNGSPGFGEVLEKALDKLNQTQDRADGLVQKFLAGEVQDLHQVTIAMQEAKISMQLAVEVRNKVIEAYQEISRMQV